jgi:hypothetical protein
MTTELASLYHSIFYEVYENRLKKFDLGAHNLWVMEVVHALPMTIQQFSIELQVDLTPKSK